MNRGAWMHISYGHAWNDTPFLRDWNGHSIPAGMEWSFLWEWNGFHSIPEGMEWTQFFYKSNQTCCEKSRKIIKANDACLQKALFTFSHGYFAPASWGRRKKDQEYLYKSQQDRIGKLSTVVQDPVYQAGQQTNRVSAYKCKCMKTKTLLLTVFLHAVKQSENSRKVWLLLWRPIVLVQKNIKMVYFTFIWKNLDIFIHTFFL